MTAHVNVFLNVELADKADIAAQLERHLSRLLGLHASVAILDAADWDLRLCDFCDVVLTDGSMLTADIKDELCWARERKKSVAFFVLRMPPGPAGIDADETVDPADIAALLKVFNTRHCWSELRVTLARELHEAARALLISARVAGMSIPGVPAAPASPRAARRNAVKVVDRILGDANVLALVPEAIAHIIAQRGGNETGESEVAAAWRAYRQGFPERRRELHQRHVHARSLAHVLGETGPSYRLSGRFANTRPTILLTDLSSDDPIRAIVNGLCSDLIQFAADADFAEAKQALNDEVTEDKATRELLEHRAMAEALPRFYRIDAPRELPRILDLHRDGAPEGIVLVGCPGDCLDEAADIARDGGYRLELLRREEQPLDALREVDRRIRTIGTELAGEAR